MYQSATLEKSRETGTALAIALITMTILLAFVAIVLSRTSIETTIAYNDAISQR
jgi:hypothetical protein